MTEKQYKCPKCGHDLIYDYEIGYKVVFYCTECEKRVMALKG